MQHGIKSTLGAFWRSPKLKLVGLVCARQKKTAALGSRAAVWQRRGLSSAFPVLPVDLHAHAEASEGAVVKAVLCIAKVRASATIFCVCRRAHKVAEIRLGVLEHEPHVFGHPPVDTYDPGFHIAALGKFARSAVVKPVRAAVIHRTDAWEKIR